MNHWHFGDEEIIMQDNDDWFNDCRVLSIYLESNYIVLQEECDSCYRIRKTKQEAIDMLQQAIDWIKEN